jgi:hypothetical protein
MLYIKRTCMFCKRSLSSLPSSSMAPSKRNVLQCLLQPAIMYSGRTADGQSSIVSDKEGRVDPGEDEVGGSQMVCNLTGRFLTLCFSITSLLFVRGRQSCDISNSEFWTFAFSLLECKNSRTGSKHHTTSLAGWEQKFFGLERDRERETSGIPLLSY